MKIFLVICCAVMTYGLGFSLGYQWGFNSLKKSCIQEIKEGFGK